MDNLKLSDAFARYGAMPAPPLRALSAIASDNSMVMLCAAERFLHHAQGVLRYEDRLSRGAATSRGAVQLGTHLTMAREMELPVRLIVQDLRPVPPARSRRAIHMRSDLVGRVVEFDGDHFIVDFTRPSAAEPAAEPERRRRKGRRP